MEHDGITIATDIKPNSLASWRVQVISGTEGAKPWRQLDIIRDSEVWVRVLIDNSGCNFAGNIEFSNGRHALLQSMPHNAAWALVDFLVEHLPK